MNSKTTDQTSPPPYEAPIGFQQGTQLNPPSYQHPGPGPHVYGTNVSSGRTDGPTIVIPGILPLGPRNANVICPHCQHNITTHIEKSPSRMAYTTGILLAFLGCFCGCCLIPCCLDSCKTVEHSCPNCTQFVGQYSKYN